MSKTTNKFSPEVRERAVRLVLDNEHEHPSRWAAIESIAGKIGCVPQTLLEWVKKAEINAGKRPGVPSEMAGRDGCSWPRASCLSWDWPGSGRITSKPHLTLTPTPTHDRRTSHEGGRQGEEDVMK